MCMEGVTALRQQHGGATCSRSAVALTCTFSIWSASGAGGGGVVLGRSSAGGGAAPPLIFRFSGRGAQSPVVLGGVVVVLGGGGHYSPSTTPPRSPSKAKQASPKEHPRKQENLIFLDSGPHKKSKAKQNQTPGFGVPLGGEQNSLFSASQGGGASSSTRAGGIGLRTPPAPPRLLGFALGIVFWALFYRKPRGSHFEERPPSSSTSPPPQRSSGK